MTSKEIEALLRIKRVYYDNRTNEIIVADYYELWQYLNYEANAVYKYMTLLGEL